MRTNVPWGWVFGAVVVVGACSSAGESGAGDPGSNGGPSPGDDLGNPHGQPVDDSGPGSGDAADHDGDASSDNDGGDGDAATGTPAIAYIGRFDDGDALGPRAAWPGVRAVARFSGTSASVRLSQADGFSGGPSWFNVIVDGVVGTPFSVSGTSEDHVLVTGLAAGEHVVEIEKRTEANLGTVRFEGFTFPGGALLTPPARLGRRIEFLSDSTIDGFGVDGDVGTTCMGGAPPQFDDARKSAAFYTAAALNAEPFLIAYSGKGVSKNDTPDDTDTFGILYGRTLPEQNGSTWSFASWTPDVVVISLGGTDYDGTADTPAGFTTAYGALVDAVRGYYPNAHVYLTVWSQIKDDPVMTRTAMTAALQDVLTARAADTKLHFFAFTEATYPTDETGCYNHANAAHAQAAATELKTRIKNDLGW